VPEMDEKTSGAFSQSPSWPFGAKATPIWKIPLWSNAMNSWF